jgi:hypothetical protein
MGGYVVKYVRPEVQGESLFMQSSKLLHTKTTRREKVKRDFVATPYEPNTMVK